MQGFRQTYSENRSRQSSTEIPAANGKHSTMSHPPPQHAKQQHEPPRISADHHFLSDDENSASGSDEEHASPEARKQHKPQRRSNGKISHQAATSVPAKQSVQQPELASSPLQEVSRVGMLPCMSDFEKEQGSCRVAIACKC